MRRFRLTPLSNPQALAAGSLELFAVGQQIDAVLQPGHFFVAPPLRLRWEPARAEEIPWELFRGNLLDAAHARQNRSFLSWHVVEEPPHAEGTEPLLSVRLDPQARAIHVTRGIFCRVWEGHDAGNGVIESREVTRWTHELVGSLNVDDFGTLDDLCDELTCLIWQAVVGTSRLPLHSVEAPLPAFTFGRLAYIHRPHLVAPEQASVPMRTWHELLEHGMHAELAWQEQVKLVETVLRHVDPADLSAAARTFLGRWRDLGHADAELPRLLRTLFNTISLSPWTCFADNALMFAEALVRHGALTAAQECDFLGHLLRQLGRHLTAYDLVTFHHRGANYPDALLLDAVLKRYLERVEAMPALFADDSPVARLRRRALRHGCLARRHYEGHFVPDMPTSPGENARVMCDDYPHVPEEQLTQLLRRRRRLFEGEPLTGLLGPRARAVLIRSVHDLADAAERAELGMAVFIDRPLGYAKAATEPDQTPLLAHETYSPSIALRRLDALGKLLEVLGVGLPAPLLLDVRSDLRTAAPVAGLDASIVAPPGRPVASLSDVRRVADDFVIVCTLPGGLGVLWQQFDFAPLLRRYRLPFDDRGQGVRLFVQVATESGPVLTAYDEQLRPRLTLSLDVGQGHNHRAGIEAPSAGLLALSVWEDADSALRQYDLDGERVALRTT